MARLTLLPLLPFRRLWRGRAGIPTVHLSSALPSYGFAVLKKLHVSQ